MKEFDTITSELEKLINTWHPKLQGLEAAVICNRRNRQNRTIKQIVGHMIDSASNNIHRVIHLQYQPLPLAFPDYANLGANDRWIALQNYQNEEWNVLIALWLNLNLHFIHVIKNIDPATLKNIWISALKEEITLQNMVVDYPRHFKLHLAEIEALTQEK